MKKNKTVKISPEVRNIRELVEFSSKKYADNVAYKYKKDMNQKPVEYIEKTYEQVGKDVKALSTALLNEGFAGKRISVIGGNRYEWCLSYFAITSAGIVVAPMDKALPEVEIASLVQRSEIEAVIFEEKHLEIFKKLKNDFSNNLKTLICMDDVEDEEVIKLSDLIEGGNKLLEANDKRYEQVKINEEEMGIMLFTSGTTSASKIVMLSQKNICSNLYAYQTHFKILPTDTLLSFLPIHHTFESSITINYGFFCGATIAFCDGLRYIQQNLAEYQVSVFVTVPLLLETMLKKINKGIEEQGKTKLIKVMTAIANFLLKLKIDIRKKVFKQILDKFGGKLRIILYGAAALDKETIIGFNNFGINAIQGYGLTESSPVLTAEAETVHRPGSVGYPLDNVQIKILDPDAEGTGEIAAKGPNIMLGYYNDEEKTKETFEDGWFKTGDLGYIDKDGYLFITGRKKDLIVLKNGKNVYPTEIESLINKLEYVDESMVYSREQSKTDTLLVAKIVYNKEKMEELYKDQDYEKVIWEAVKEINKELPTYKHVKKIVVTDEPMIKTTTQKVKRFEEIKKTENELNNK